MKYTLYQFEHCPFCAKVRANLDKKCLEYEKIDVANDREDPLRKEIAEQSGIKTVPVLKVSTEKGDSWIGDSRKIIEWLESL